MLSAPALKLLGLCFYEVINGGKRREGQTEGAGEQGQGQKKGHPQRGQPSRLVFRRRRDAVGQHPNHHQEDNEDIHQALAPNMLTLSMP